MSRVKSGAAMPFQRLFALAALLITPCSVHAFEFQWLGDLPGGDVSSQARSVSSEGRIVAGESKSDGVSREAFVWNPDTGMVGLGFLTDSQEGSSWAFQVSGDGQAIVGVTADLAVGVGEGRGSAFRWTSESGMQDLGSFDADLSLGALATNFDGATVVGVARSLNNNFQGDRAFRWTEQSGVQLLPPAPWFGDQMHQAFARDVSKDGSVVLGTTEPNRGNLDKREGFLYYPRTDDFIHIEPVGDMLSIDLRNLSDDGHVAVGKTDYAFSSEIGRSNIIWTEQSGPVDVGGLPGRHALGSIFYGVSGNGAVAVGQEFVQQGDAVHVYPTMWDRVNGVRNIEELLRNDYGMDLGTAKLERAFAASEDGLTIVGHGINGDGMPEGWRVVLEPTTFLTPQIGDVNSDGKVEFDDFLTLSTNFETGHFWYEGDFNGDYLIDDQDFKLLLRRFGQRTASSVPEPSSSHIVLILLLLYRRLARLFLPHLQQRRRA